MDSLFKSRHLLKMFSSLLRYPFSQPGTLFSLALIYKFNWLKKSIQENRIKIKRYDTQTLPVLFDNAHYIDRGE
jgi:hypothetical protein